LNLEIEWAQIKFKNNWFEYIFLEEIINDLCNERGLSQEQLDEILIKLPSNI